MDSSGNPRRLASYSQEALIQIALRSSSALAEAATERLLSLHEPLMKREISAASTPARLFEDALQAAREGALQALRRFDPSRGFTFGVFARKHIRGRVLGAVYVKVRRTRGHTETSPRPVSIVSLDERLENSPWMEDDLFCDPGEVYEQVEKSDMLERVCQFVDGLSARQRYIVRRVFYEVRSQADVAHELGISEAAVSQTLARVYAKGKVELTEFEGLLAA